MYICFQKAWIHCVLFPMWVLLLLLMKLEIKQVLLKVNGFVYYELAARFY